MSAGKLEIVFDGDRGEVPRVEPGSTLSGRAIFTPRAEAKVDGVSIAVGWKTRGKGNDDEKEVWSRKEEIPTEGRVVEASRTVSWPFRCQLPDSPWSYDGKIVSIYWEVTVRLDVPWAKDPCAKRAFVLRPPPA